MSTTPSSGRRVGIDNYGLFPLGLSPMDTLAWAVRHGADGVAFSGLSPEHHAAISPASLADLRACAESHGLYLEWGGGQHIPRNMATWAPKDIFDDNLRAAREASALGVRIVRSCSGGLMRWDPHAPPTEELLTDTAAALIAQRQMLRDHGVVLAIETHFEFTSFELRRLMDMCEATPGDWLGICLDTMNLLTMIEHPVSATERLLPWIVSTHVKDGGILAGHGYLQTFPTPLGAGVVDVRRIISMLDAQPWDVHLNVEDHAGEFDLPIGDAAFLGRFPDVSGNELHALVQLSEVCAGRPQCRPLERRAWPGVCDARMAADLAALRALADTMPRVVP